MHNRIAAHSDPTMDSGEPANPEDGIVDPDDPFGSPVLGDPVAPIDGTLDPDEPSGSPHSATP